MNDTVRPYSGETTVLACAEIIMDQNGNVLFNRPYIFSRTHAPGHGWLEDSVQYTVTSAAITYGKLGGALVEYVVKVGW